MTIRRHVANIRTYATFVAVIGSMMLLGCSSKPQSQPPTAEEQKKIQQDYQKTMERQKQLTSGYDKSMQNTPPSTGYVPNKANAGKQKQPTKQRKSPQQQSQQQSAQQSPPKSQPK